MRKAFGFGTLGNALFLAQTVPRRKKVTKNWSERPKKGTIPPLQAAFSTSALIDNVEEDRFCPKTRQRVSEKEATCKLTVVGSSHERFCSFHRPENGL
jgi:hypothetical protein